jgi:Na+/melibiose symporter-like transporter
MKPSDDPLERLGVTLACALLAQVISVLLAALLASTVPGGYRARAFAFLGGVAWTLIGTVLLVIQTVRAEPRGEDAQRGVLARLAPRRIALWIVSSWLWPILVRWRPRR